VHEPAVDVHARPVDDERVRHERTVDVKRERIPFDRIRSSGKFFRDGREFAGFGRAGQQLSARDELGVCLVPELQFGPGRRPRKRNRPERMKQNDGDRDRHDRPVQWAHVKGFGRIPRTFLSSPRMEKLGK
jgi:hypothetical protein